MPETNAVGRPPDAPRALLLLVFALVLSPFARGETLEQYDVEVIVFRNLSGQSDGEQWPLRDPVTGDALPRSVQGISPADLPVPAAMLGDARRLLRNRGS